MQCSLTITKLKAGFKIDGTANNTKSKFTIYIQPLGTTDEDKYDISSPFVGVLNVSVNGKVDCYGFCVVDRYGGKYKLIGYSCDTETSSISTILPTVFIPANQVALKTESSTPISYNFIPLPFQFVVFVKIPYGRFYHGVVFTNICELNDRVAPNDAYNMDPDKVVILLLNSGLNRITRISSSNTDVKSLLHIISAAALLARLDWNNNLQQVQVFVDIGGSTPRHHIFDTGRKVWK